jgi:O-succinylbenzoate synthase
VGREVASGDALGERLAPFRGNPFAKAALDTAWWDLRARLVGKPLYEILGAQRDAVEVGVGFDRMDSIDELFRAMAKAFDAGFARVELKIRPGWDVQMLNAVRHEFPTETIHVDVEGALSLDHVEILYRLDDFMVAMVEQPLPADDLVGHFMVQQGIRTPICLDESVTSVELAEIALSLLRESKLGEREPDTGRTAGDAIFINVKRGRVGGITPAVTIHDMCRDADVPCWVGAMPQSAIGFRATMALATKANFTYPADFVCSEELFREDLAEPLVPARDKADGPLRIPLWPEPGIGAEPDPRLLERFCLAQAKV